MNILFLSVSRQNDINQRGIYTDLLRELIKYGHKVYIASPIERQFGQDTHLTKSDSYEILSIKTLNIQKTNIIEKGIGTLSLEWLYKRAIKKYWENVKFDLILYATPPITLNSVIIDVKKRCNARTYLMLKDIFPQNAVDLGMFSRKSIIYKMFRRKEETLYKISDKIGCMSPANVKYVLANNPEVNPSKVEICPNSITLTDYRPLSATERVELLSKLNIPSDKTIFIYGGNLGKPQGLDFMLEVIKENEKNDNSYIVVVGSGTEYNRINKWFCDNKPKNACLHKALPKEEYDKLIKAADVGLIFLDRRFTIPNYPSRLLSYLENKMPVLMATDLNTDIGTIAEENGYGMWCENGDINKFMSYIDTLKSDSTLRDKMGEDGYKFLSDNYLVKNTIEKILS